VAALSHSGYPKANPAARSRPGTTRRLLSSNSVSERSANAPNSAEWAGGLSVVGVTWVMLVVGNSVVWADRIGCGALLARLAALR
jgi:hypothetical protein